MSAQTTHKTKKPPGGPWNSQVIILQEFHVNMQVTESSGVIPIKCFNMNPQGTRQQVLHYSVRLVHSLILQPLHVQTTAAGTAQSAITDVTGRKLKLRTWQMRFSNRNVQQQNNNNNNVSENATGLCLM